MQDVKGGLVRDEAVGQRDKDHDVEAGDHRDDSEGAYGQGHREGEEEGACMEQEDGSGCKEPDPQMSQPPEQESQGRERERDEEHQVLADEDKKDCAQRQLDQKCPVKH